MSRPSKLFLASCFALIATSMAFSIRADIIPALKLEFGLNDSQMGIIAGTGLWGFTVTIILGGILVDLFGMKLMLATAFLGHLLGVVLTLNAQGYSSLYWATLVIGLSNGMVEAVTNPLVTTLFKEQKTQALNRLHAWWPGGLIIGGLASFALTKYLKLDLPSTQNEVLFLGWRLKMGLILVPTSLYGILLMTQKFPQTERLSLGVATREMWKEALKPFFIFFAGLMMLTAATELGPDQWVGNLLANLAGIQGVLLLVYTAGIMFVLRNYLSGYILARFSPIGVLTFAALLSFVGLFLLSASSTPALVLLAATVFGIGKTFFWPNMLGVVSERFPKGGALVLGIMGGMGMLSAGWFAAPIMGKIQDHYAISYLQPEVRQLVVTNDGLDETKVSLLAEPEAKSLVEKAKQHSATMTYRWVSVLPAALFFIFLAIWKLLPNFSSNSESILRKALQRKEAAYSQN